MRVIETKRFARWLRHLKDKVAKMRIANYFDALQHDEPASADLKPVGDGVMEARFHCGPGYRVYFLVERESVLLLLVGGDKDSQQRDIADAKKLASEWRAHHGIQ